MRMTPASPTDLPRLATRARRNVVRMLQAGGSGHLGGAFSCIDIVTTLYACILNVDPSRPHDPERDRFLLSAGHKALAQYAVLTLLGYTPVATLDSYGEYGSVLPGHPDMHKLAGVEANTGALGHGAAIAAGMALAARLDAHPRRTVVVLGDGELTEGSNWEAFAAAAHHRLGSLTAVIDCNGLQISGSVSEIMDMSSVRDKLRAFGWRTREIDGHDFDQIMTVFSEETIPVGPPTAVIAHTVKGQGLDGLAGRVESHYWTPDADELNAALRELDDRLARFEEVGAAR